MLVENRSRPLMRSRNFILFIPPDVGGGGGGFWFHIEFPHVTEV